MEYCPETLESRIHGAGQKALGSESGSMLDSVSGQVEVESLWTRTTEATTVDESIPPSSEFDWESVVDILEDVNRGLVYLHQNGTVHRDLKPKNGNTRLPHDSTDFGYSALFRTR